MENIVFVLCRKCKIEKEVSEFVPSQLAKGNSKCKSCQKEYSRENKVKILEYNKVYYQENKTQLDVRHNDYYRENKDHLLECRKKYFQENEEANISKKEYDKKYRQENKDYYNNYCKIRRRNDPLYRLRQDMSRSIRTKLKRNKSRKNGKSCIKYLSYTTQELKVHLEVQFEHWMTWDNQGKYDPIIWDDNDMSTWTWQIDHIIPHSTFNYTSMEDQAFRDCWALSNLRPLSAKQNLLDGVRRIRH
jgi:hypothetical protein